MSLSAYALDIFTLLGCKNSIRKSGLNLIYANKKLLFNILVDIGNIRIRYFILGRGSERSEHRFYHCCRD